MIPTITWISKKFDEFNKEYFYGVLEKPMFEISSTRSYWGQCTWKWERGTRKKVWTGRRYIYCPDYKKGSAKIRISKFYDVPEHNIEETLIHEMIHLYFVQNNMCWVNHGVHFKREAYRISKMGKHHIDVTGNYRCDVNKEVAQKKRKNYQVFVVREKYGLRRYLYIYGNEDKKVQNKKAVKSWIESPFLSIKYEFVESFISDHDMFIGRRSSIRYTTNRATAYFFKNTKEYEEVAKTAKYIKKAA